MLTHPDEGTRASRSARDSWPLSFTLNGQPVSIDVPPTMTLLDVLRTRLHRTGTKGACLEGECGSCTVLVDGVPQNACLILAPQIEGRSVVSVEGVASEQSLDALQQKFVDAGAVQCGYCTPGLVLAAKAFLERCDGVPSDQQVREGLEGNICRCTGYNKIVDAVVETAREVRA